MPATRFGDLADEIYQLAQQQEWDSNAKRDREFHHRIAELSGSHTLLRLTDNDRFVSKVFWVGQPGSVAETRKSHLQILELIRSNRPQDAERAAREHVARGRRHVEELSSRGRFDPHWLV